MKRQQVIFKAVSSAEPDDRYELDNFFSQPLRPLAPSLKPVDYWRYAHPITMYHYNYSLLSIRALNNSLTLATLGYVHSLTCASPFMAFAEGDETPAGCTEAFYLPSVFQGQGSAVGLRYRTHASEEMRVEWLCFRGPIEEVLEESRSRSGHQVFDKVGFLEKGEMKVGRGRRRDGEHRDWYRSLVTAEMKDVKLKLTWKNRELDRLAETKTGEQVDTRRKYLPTPTRSPSQSKSGRTFWGMVADGYHY